MCLLLNLIGTPVSEEATVICVNTLLQVWLWLRRCNELLALPVPSCQCIHWTGVLRTHYIIPVHLTLTSVTAIMCWHHGTHTDLIM